MRYEILVTDRKEIVRKLEEITGIRPRYTGMPAAAYVLNGLIIENDGMVTAEEGADMNLVDQLVEAGLISGDMVTESDELISFADEGLPEEPREQTADALENDYEDNDEDEHWHDDEEDPDAVKPTVSFPLEKHGRDSIVNLVCSIFSKGSLISKSTGGTFKAAKELVDRLKIADTDSKEDAIRMIQEYGEDGLVGISFEDYKVTFDGFKPTSDPDEVKAWTALAAAINQNAIDQKHVRAKEADESNEKFAFRTWLTRLGMKGADTKMERKILYKNLSGHTAFRTEEDQKKWAAVMKEKREAKKADADAADTAESDGAEE